MSTSSRLPIGELHAVLDEIGAVDPIYLTTTEKRSASLGLAKAEARLQAARLRLLATSDDIAEATGDRSTASWLATQTRDAHGTLRRDAALARALESRWTQTADALAAGVANLAQARVMVEVLDLLPRELGEDLLAKAEAHLVEKAAEFGPRELRNLGRGLLEVVAPDIADQHEYQRLLAEEAAASAATTLTIRPRGDGSADIHARVPTQAAGRLRAYLNAYTAPRRRHLRDTVGDLVETPYGPLATAEPAEPDEVARLPIGRQRGIAFVALLENIPTTQLPRHGGTATSVMVTLDYDTLVSGVGVATTSTGERVTAGQARRLACQAGIIPVVLDGGSEILDVGRLKRLVPDAIRKALNLRDQGCTEVGCTMPAEFCEAHHIVPWSKGGKTSLKDCKLLCPFHHHRAHDPAWDTHHHPNGTTSFTRRQ